MDPYGSLWSPTGSISSLRCEGNDVDAVILASAIVASCTTTHNNDSSPTAIGIVICFHHIIMSKFFLVAESPKWFGNCQTYVEMHNAQFNLSVQHLTGKRFQKTSGISFLCDTGAKVSNQL